MTPKNILDIWYKKCISGQKKGSTAKWYSLVIILYKLFLETKKVYNAILAGVSGVLAVISLILAIASRGGDDYDDEDDYDDPFEEEHDN